MSVIYFKYVLALCVLCVRGAVVLADAGKLAATPSELPRHVAPSGCRTAGGAVQGQVSREVADSDSPSGRAPLT